MDTDISSGKSVTDVTEPSDITAALSEEILDGIVHADPTYRLRIARGHVRPTTSGPPPTAATR
jgi:hypothetical protein